MVSTHLPSGKGLGHFSAPVGQVSHYSLCFFLSIGFPPGDTFITLNFPVFDNHC